jgi:hypothetical protein
VIATDPGTIAMVQGFRFSIKIWGFTHTRQLVREDVRILTHYWNFIKRGDNGHIGTRVGTVLER